MTREWKKKKGSSSRKSPPRFENSSVRCGHSWAHTHHECWLHRKEGEKSVVRSDGVKLCFGTKKKKNSSLHFSLCLHPPTHTKKREENLEYHTTKGFAARNVSSSSLFCGFVPFFFFCTSTPPSLCVYPPRARVGLDLHKHKHKHKHQLCLFCVEKRRIVSLGGGVVHTERAHC